MKQHILIKNGIPFIDTQSIARVIGRKHNQILEVLEKVFIDYPEIRGRNATPEIDNIQPCFIPDKRNYQGEEFTAYLLNETAFNLILPRFRTRKALDAFLVLITSFQKMKTALLQIEANKDNLLWQELRTEGKQTRHSLTDAIQDFITYSKGQGSTGYRFMYANITKAIYSCLDIDMTISPKARDSLPKIKLQQLEKLEHNVSMTLSVGMSNQRPYKGIKAELKHCIDEFKPCILEVA